MKNIKVPLQNKSFINHNLNKRQITSSTLSKNSSFIYSINSERENYNPNSCAERNKQKIQKIDFTHCEYQLKYSTKLDNNISYKKIPEIPLFNKNIKKRNKILNQYLNVKQNNPVKNKKSLNSSKTYLINDSYTSIKIRSCNNSKKKKFDINFPERNIFNENKIITDNKKQNHRSTSNKYNSDYEPIIDKKINKSQDKYITNLKKEKAYNIERYSKLNKYKINEKEKNDFEKSKRRNSAIIFNTTNNNFNRLITHKNKIINLKKITFSKYNNSYLYNKTIQNKEKDKLHHLKKRVININKKFISKKNITPKEKFDINSYINEIKTKIDLNEKKHKQSEDNMKIEIEILKNKINQYTKNEVKYKKEIEKLKNNETKKSLDDLKNLFNEKLSEILLKYENKNNMILNDKKNNNLNEKQIFLIEELLKTLKKKKTKKESDNINELEEKIIQVLFNFLNETNINK